LMSGASSIPIRLIPPCWRSPARKFRHATT
jgi:hypothetical protein